MKNSYIAKRHWKAQSNAMGKSDEVAKSFDDCINLSLGDPDLITDRLIIDKAYEDSCAGYTHYANFQGDPELRDEVIKFYQEEYDMDIKDNEVFITSSGCIGMYLALEAILDRGDEVILQAPFFTPYPEQVRLAGGVPVQLPTYEGEDFQISVQRMESLINERTRAIVLNSPSNPTGNCLTVDTMKKIGEIAEKYDLIVIADDIYTAFSYQQKFVPFASMPGMFRRTITINSFSKNFLMTGWRVGNIIAPHYFINTIQQINNSVMFTAPSISQRAGIHALRNRDKIQPPIIEEFKKRMFYAAERVNGLKNMHVLYPPKGSFYLFINIKDSGMTSQEAADKILREAHVLMLPGDAFGDCGEGFLRAACTVTVEKLGEAFDRIGKIKEFNPEA